MKILTNLLVVCGVVTILIGVMLDNKSIVGLNLSHSVTISMYQYNNHTVVKAYEDVGVWDDLGMFYAIRIDTVGDTKSASDVMRQLRAHLVDIEVISKVTVMYGYSPMLPLRQIVNASLVNLMIAIVDNNMSIGYPILMGSY